MLILKNVSAGYGGNFVLRGVSFTLAAGESISIIGPNGCGKTTLLKTIASLLDYGGEISVSGRDVKNIPRLEAAREIAMLSQITPVYFNLTVYETVMLGRYAHIPRGMFAKPGAADREAVENALRNAHMLDLKDRELDTLSGGQLQRVFLAKALAQDPKIILLDEPTNHLDLSYQLELIEFLKRWSTETGRSVVGVMHDINLALMLSGRVLLMDDGAAFDYAEGELTTEALGRVFKTDVAAFMRGVSERWEGVKRAGA